jgi:hypothetical protein
LKAIAALAVACLIIGQLAGGVATATCAAYALFWLSPKALLLFGASLLLTVGLARLLDKVVLPFARKQWE